MRQSTAMLTAAALALATGCTDAGDLDGDPIETAEIGAPDEAAPAGTETKGYVLGPSLWPSSTIPVCWENVLPGYATERIWVRDALQDTWEKVSRVSFVGWGQCTEGQSGIHIRTIVGDFEGEPTPKVKELGKGLSGMEDGMILWFEYNGSFSPGCEQPGNREMCIRRTAIHEFGHALGISHEHNRPDRPDPDTCDADAQGTDGDILVGPYDHDSVMNYCAAPYRLTLSRGDILTVQAMYGAPSGSLVGEHHAMCLEPFLPGGNGATVRLRACNRSLVAQNWDYERATLQFAATNGRVLAVSSSDPTYPNGSVVELRDSSTSVNQKWEFKDVEVRGWARLCLQAMGTANGSSVRMYHCDGGNDQKWTLTTSGQLRSTSSGKCLDVEDSGTSNGTRVQLWTCNGSASMAWSLEPGARLVGYGSNCLDVAGFSTANGATAQMWDCTNSSNQRWSLSGHLRGVVQKCLDADLNGTTGSVIAQLWGCWASANQNWAYTP